ncbi:MAG: NAD(P)-dependent alcohol dehydrogenase [Hyphomicrobiaceae bacterium]|nr:NAD(P)-dependent alcohol dehydrogenase [Hyphomicrobiaceae bacterium]
MKAAVCTAYGAPEVVRVVDVPAPVAGPNDVLIRIHAATLSSGDARIRGANFPPGFSIPARLFLGLTRPRNPVLGTELAGLVEAVGQNVTRFQKGDRVFAFPGVAMGCHAELKVMPHDGAIALMPPDFSFEEAAAIAFGGTTALYFLRDVANVQRGEKVLINGASGAVGSAAVQLAKHYGCHVTGVCSAANSALVRALGADEVIDYNASDFAAPGLTWDVILDTVGNAPFARCRNALNKDGRLLIIAASLGELVKAPFQSKMSGLRVAGGTAPERAQDIAELKNLCEAGAFKPVIDSCFPLDRICDAHARADTHRKVGSVVVTL